MRSPSLGEMRRDLPKGGRAPRGSKNSISATRKSLFNRARKKSTTTRTSTSWREADVKHSRNCTVYMVVRGVIRTIEVN